MTPPATRRGEAGLTSVEMVVLTPLILALLALVVGLGRAADARGRLTGAVRDAARAASLTATPAAATAAARQTAFADLQGAGLECRDPQVSTDTSQFAPGGQVQVTISCALDLAALVVSGLPGRSTVTVHAVVPLDTFSLGVSPWTGLGFSIADGVPPESRPAVGST